MPLVFQPVGRAWAHLPPNHAIPGDVPKKVVFCCGTKSGNVQNVVPVRFPQQPSSLKLKMNSKWLKQEQYPTVGPFRALDRPIDLTPHLDYDREGGQHLTIDLSCLEGCLWIGVAFVEEQSVSMLMESVCLRSGLCVGPNLWGIIQEIRSGSRNNKLSLVDPASKRRLEVPVISKNCEHLEGMDLEPFLLWNKVVGVWRCYICLKEVKVEDLVVCDWILKGLAQDTTALEAEVQIASVDDE